MENEILTYTEMCLREGASLQRGMNFAQGKSYSVVLMSRRRGSPYNDSMEEGGSVLIYEGHDVTAADAEDPKAVDQPLSTANGKPTQNGKFVIAAEAFKRGERPAELVRVYEKVRTGIWVFNGTFRLVDWWKQNVGVRQVVKFKLILAEEVAISGSPTIDDHPRQIPSAVKAAVYKRDKGKCVICGSAANLHFDHDLPYSKGGSSVGPDNVRLLCAAHNLSKGAKIQ